MQQVHDYYSCKEDNRYCEIEVLGKLIEDNDKCGSNKIKIVREITGAELNSLKGLERGNTGDWNTGYWNTGTFNKCNYSNGFFNTKEPTVNIFNVDSGMTASEFYNSKYYDALISSPFILTEWIKDESKGLIGGYLIEYTFEEACKNWWNKMSDNDKEIIKSIPNFNAKIFKEITGIEVE